MKIIPKITINVYELTFLLLPTLLDKEVEKIQKDISELIESQKGKIVDYQNWGRKKLAYFIKRDGVSLKEAIYQHFVFELNSKKIDEFKKKVIFDKDIIRSLVVVDKKKKIDKSKIKKEEKQTKLPVKK